MSFRTFTGPPLWNDRNASGITNYNPSSETINSSHYEWKIKGQIASYYKETPKSASTQWPPRFMKFILYLRDESTRETAEIAFLDARRLGRIRLRDSPATEAPISELGFDPILCMPSLDEFKPLVLKRSCPIKALLLDQSFSAGVGNWVAGHLHFFRASGSNLTPRFSDEILYHAHVHPEQRCNTLTPGQIEDLHRCTRFVCETAVSVDADDTKFPDDWLFKHRWVIQRDELLIWAFIWPITIRARERKQAQIYWNWYACITGG